MRLPASNSPLLTVLVAILLLPMSALAGPDASLQGSLEKFFAGGVHWQQASAELIKVERWPDTKGSVRWHLPNLHGHPKRVALIAEQGNGKEIKRWYVPVQLHWWAKVLVASQPLSARALLSKDMMKQSRADIAGHHGKFWQQDDTLIGMRLTRSIDKDAVILSSYVNRPPMIRRGDPVEIILDTGFIHVRTAGEALRSAARGERILVRNIHSKEVLQAIAESSNSVRVTLAGVQG